MSSRNLRNPLKTFKNLRKITQKLSACKLLMNNKRQTLITNLVM